MLINEKLPNFEFEVYVNDTFKKVKLSDYKGKWLIFFFYPADFTFVCPTELEDLQKHYESFKKQGAEIICVSTDTVYVHKAWHDHSPIVGKVEYPMAADPTGKLARSFGVYIENEGISLRGSFIVDPDGILKAIEVNDNSIGRNASELLRKFEASKYVEEHKGEVCPAMWVPGKPTLKPGVKLVGKL
jgi:peroxiredoxin (alkyl hydroperoxide reductase subunit C)